MMKRWDILIDTPNYEQWIYGVESADEPIIYDGCYVLDARLSEDQEDNNATNRYGS